MRRRTTVACTLALLLFTSLAACKEKREASPVLLRVDGRTVTLSEFRQEFAKTLPPEQKLSNEEKGELERSYLVQLIDRELALVEALRRGLEVTPGEIEAAVAEHRRDYPDDAFEQMLRERGITLEQWRQDLEKSLLMEKAVRQAVYEEIVITPEEIRDYYERHRGDFDRPAQVRARQIVVGTLEDGERILAQLRQGEAFEAMARSFSLSPDSEEGGDLGFFARGEMPPEFEKVVFSIPVGKISDLVKSEYGYHLFRVEERRESIRLNLEQVREEIRGRLQAEKEELNYQEWLRTLRSKAVIEIDWSLL
ncbi:MAG: peptidylprolyl isomerase [Desulfuromonadales bacterium]|nr:peptidylprolyl isomerase [Desulfuromonadales bacterium]